MREKGAKDAKERGETASMTARPLMWGFGCVVVALGAFVVAERGRRQDATSSVVRTEMKQPDWATDYGQDTHGVWVEMTVGPVTQRFRFVEAGSFTEADNLADGDFPGGRPLRRVTVSNGFWLADTECSQAFWSTVTKTNPSRFNADAHLPVENVSFHDCRDFIKALRQMKPGMPARLPTPNEWRLAALAGRTNAPIDAGELTRRKVNLDAGGIVGTADAAGWAGGTVRITALPPNSFGIYGMFGNVWEWCDTGAGNTHAPFIGGSWRTTAEYCHVHTWGGGEPNVRRDDLGLRIAVDEP